MASTVGDALTNAASAVLEAVGRSIASLGTLWTSIGTPALTGGDGSSGRAPGATAPQAAGLETALSYTIWISLGICVLSLMAVGARLAWQRDAARDGVNRLVTVLIATVVISSATAIVAGLVQVQGGSGGGSPTVAYLQNSLVWYTAALAILAVIVGGARMAWEQRAEPGWETVKGLLTLVVVSGCGLTVIGLCVAAADAFAIWIIDGSLDCNIADSTGSCFGGNMTGLLMLTNTATGGLGSILIIVLGLIAVVSSLLQIALMLIRSAMLVLLAGVLPTMAAATNTEAGRTWFRRGVGWTIAFILYKPAAAIVYAAAFQLAGTNVFRDDGTGLISVITGLGLMVIALIALPALMRFVMPLTAAVAGGGAGAAVAMGAATALPTGAVQLSQALSRGGQWSAGGGGDAGAAPDGASGGGGPSGPSGGPGPDGPTAPDASASAAGVSAPGSAASGGGGAAASGGAAGAGAGAASAGGGAAAGAGAGAVGGPVGIAVGAAAGAALQAGRVAGQVGQQAAAATKAAAEESAGEGPSGSR